MMKIKDRHVNAAVTFLAVVLVDFLDGLLDVDLPLANRGVGMMANRIEEK